MDISIEFFEGIEGISRLKDKNNAFLYVLSLVWYVEKVIQWFNTNIKGYNILEKICNYINPSNNEKEWIKKIFIGDFPIVNEVENVLEPTNIGYAVYVRYKRNAIQHHLLDE